MISISIDMGGTFVKTGIVSNGKILKKGRIPVKDNRNFEATLLLITDEINRLLSIADVNALELNGIAIAFPGLVDYDNMKVTMTHKYPTAVDFDFIKWAKDNWDTSLALINDARMAGIGEWHVGAGEGTKHMAMITLGTGIGSFATVDGKRLRGNGYRAGNLFGHISLDINGDRCQCNNLGCAESLASSWSLPQLVKQDEELNELVKDDDSVINFKWLFDLYREGNAGAIRVADKCMHVWGVLAINMIHSYDPQVLVLGGGILNSADIIVPYIRKQVDKYCWLNVDEIKIEHAFLGEDASIVGGYFLLKEILTK
ncbi:ROK family protein [Labilibacter sediminis]|nr:ROK family protein [Labilibacter sediminis]